MIRAVVHIASPDIVFTGWISAPATSAQVMQWTSLWGGSTCTSYDWWGGARATRCSYTFTPWQRASWRDSQSICSSAAISHSFHQCTQEFSAKQNIKTQTIPKKKGVLGAWHRISVAVMKKNIFIPISVHPIPVV